MIQSVSFTNAAFEAFVEAYTFFSMFWQKKKKNAQASKFLEILKNICLQE